MTRELLVVDVTNPGALFGPLAQALDGSGPAVFPVIGSHPPDHPAHVDDDVVLVVETSGSTAKPKRVWHTAESLIAAATQSQEALGAAGLWWLALPAHYIAGVMVMVRALVGGTAVIVKPPHQDLTEALGDFHRDARSRETNHPRYTSLVPKQLSDLVDVAERDEEAREALAGFSRILVGGQRVPEDLVARAKALGVSVTKTYGSAETAGGCVWDGRPLADTTIDIVDSRVALSGPMLAGGYLGDDQRTREHFIEKNATRWFLTDDVGFLDGGVLTVNGRADRVIISGGVKVNLDEVEASLQATFPDLTLATARVVDATWGEAIAIVAEGVLSEDAARELVLKHFGPAARVVRVIQTERVPLLSSGKIDRLAIDALVASIRD